MTARALAIALCAAVAVATPAAATSFWEPVPVEDDGAASEPATFDELVASATELLTTALHAHQRWRQARADGSPRAARAHLHDVKRAAELALVVLERARGLEPDNASVHYWIASVLYEYLYFYYDEQAIASKRDEVGKRAIAHWAEFERLAPRDPRRLTFAMPHGWGPTGYTPHAGPTSAQRNPYQFQRSLIYTKLGGEDNYARALEDYDYLLGRMPRDTAEMLATNLTNSAEILMAVGRLEEAIDRYREGIEISSGDSRVLYMYGLAVALDRAGFTQSALDMMAEAVLRDRAAFDQMQRASVFFVPAGDVHYYYALGHESLGNCDEAIAQYEAFLRRSTTARYHEQARNHVAYLKKARRDPKRCTPAPARIRLEGWAP